MRRLSTGLKPGVNETTFEAKPVIFTMPMLWLKLTLKAGPILAA
jgi:hypothetical protein